MPCAIESVCVDKDFVESTLCSRKVIPTRTNRSAQLNPDRSDSNPNPNNPNPTLILMKFAVDSPMPENSSMSSAVQPRPRMQSATVILNSMGMQLAYFIWKTFRTLHIGTRAPKNRSGGVRNLPEGSKLRRFGVKRRTE